MNDVTQILSAIEQGNPHAAEQLLPLVYNELRKLASEKMAQEKPGQTLEATALVHEAYLRLVASPTASPGRKSGEAHRHWNSRGHFFAAAAEAMRRILIDQARRKRRARHGGGRDRLPLQGLAAPGEADSDDLLALDEALELLAAEEPEAATVVKLRYFAGMTIEQTAEAMGLSVRTTNRHWAFARAWLFQRLRGPDAADD